MHALELNDLPWTFGRFASRASGTFRTTSCMTFTPAIRCSSNRAPSMSWSRLTSISCVFTHSIQLAPPRQAEPGCRSFYSNANDRAAASSSTRPFAGGLRHSLGFICAAATVVPESGKTLMFLTNQFAMSAASICAFTQPLARRAFPRMNQAASTDQMLHVGRRREDARIWIAISVYRQSSIVKKTPRPGSFLSHFVSDSFRHTLQEIAKIDERKIGNRLNFSIS